MTIGTVLVALFTVSLASAAQVPLGEPPPDEAKARAAAIERAKTYLAETLKTPKAEIGVHSAKAATWPDASLGCPQKDHMYAQVVTRGWTVVLKAEGVTHEVHVAGKRAVTCPAKDAPVERRAP